MNNLMVVLRKNIQYIRKLRGFIQEELVEKCEVQISYLAGVESAARNITIQILGKIINGLEVLLEDLFDLTQFLKNKSLTKELY